MEAQSLQKGPLGVLCQLTEYPLSHLQVPSSPAECHLSGPGHCSLLLSGSSPRTITPGDHKVSQHLHSAICTPFQVTPASPTAPRAQNSNK